MINKIKFRLCFAILEFNLWFLLLGALIKFSFGSAFDCYKCVNTFYFNHFKFNFNSLRLFLRLLEFGLERAQYTKITVTKRPFCRLNYWNARYLPTVNLIIFNSINCIAIKGRINHSAVQPPKNHLSCEWTLFN